MDNTKIQLAVGAMLYDTDKLNCSNDKGNENAERIDIDLDDETLGYVICAADKVLHKTAQTDLRKFAGNFFLKSIFNILNGNSGNAAYRSSALNGDDVRFPENGAFQCDRVFYRKAYDEIKGCAERYKTTEEYFNAVFEVMETYTSYIPSELGEDGLCDISFFERSKMRAAFALCIYDYLQEMGVSDYKDELLVREKNFAQQKAFLLYSGDISGIQDFIYNISGQNALKGLRARSFYLEIIMESIVDELLERLELTRANVMYVGGGHTYMLFPNTQKVKESIAIFERELNECLIDTFGTQLFVGMGYALCSKNDLCNIPEGSYSEIFKKAGQMISSRKLHRYSSEQIKCLNFSSDKSDKERECRICSRSDKLSRDDGGNICSICSSLLKLSDEIIKKSFFVVLGSKPDNIAAVPLPFGKWLTAGDDEEDLRQIIKRSEGYVRCYGKNKSYTGGRSAARLWVGDYCSDKSFANLAKVAGGIKRIAVLRADVDNLGQTFSGGFDRKYASISKTAELSKQLSMFFKLYINSILKNPQFSLDGKKAQSRNVNIIYSGGDDIFAVGAWDDIICFGVDLSRALKKYTLGSLTVSAGIGIYKEKYPIYQMAQQTGRLEEVSKENEGKNSVTLFDETACYHWEEFADKVVGEKLKTVMRFIDVSTDKGNSVLYNMMELIRECKDERLSIARFAYLCARIKESVKNDPEKYREYTGFSEKMYDWIQSESDRKQLATAICLYVYMNRESDR